jgi:large subunit ribosomal protein L24e
MVTKTDKCSYTEYKIIPGRGTRFISKDGRVHYFISSKARSLFHQKIKPVKLTWTQAWRAFNKKDTAEKVIRKTKRRVVRVQKAVVGMTLDEIKRRQQESKEDRQKLADKLAADVKDRKIKQAKDKQTKAKKAAPKAAAKGDGKAVK